MIGTTWFLAAGGTPAHNLSLFDPVSPPAEAIRQLAVLVLAICGGIFVVVEGVLIYSVWRFRGRGAPGAEPPQVYGSKPIEIAWTAAPALVVFVLVLVIVRTEREVRADPDHPPAGSQPLYVSVIGRQWWWELRYESYNGRPLGFATANELHVPASQPGKRGPDVPEAERAVDRPVFLTLRSADVAHSFWVPRLAGKTDLIPRRTNRMWFQTDQPGLYVGQCAEYCGTQHANMLLRVYVDPPGEFERWLEGQARPAADEPAARAGRAAFARLSCVNCHEVRGLPTVAGRAGYAPDLTHLMSRHTLAAGVLLNDPEGDNLRRWVADPQTVKPGCLMPAFGLNERELNLVAGYLRTLR